MMCPTIFRPRGLGTGSTGLFAALCGAASLTACLLAAPARAGTVTTWTGGGGNGNWSDGANWSTAVNTTGIFDLIFGGTTQVLTSNNVGIVKVDTMSFINTGSLSAQANNIFKIDGAALSMTNGVITTSSATNGSTYNGDEIGSALLLSGSNRVTLGVSHPLSFKGDISGAGASLTFTGGGSPFSISYLSGSNSYSGGTLLTGGFVATGARLADVGAISNNFALGTGPVTVAGTSSLLIRNDSVISNPLTISGNGAGSGALTGSFGVANSTAEYRGNITLAGNARFSTASSAVGDVGSKLLVSGNVDLGPSLLTLRSQREPVAGTVGLLIEITGTMFGTGGVNVESNGSWGRVLISGSNSYSGGTTVTTGTLIVGDGSALGTGFLAVNTSALDLNGQTLNVGTLSGSASGVIRTSLSGTSKLITTSTTDSTYAGVIVNGAGTVGLAKAGSGVLSLTGSNTYTGITNVNGGVISLDSLLAIGSSGPITFGGGTLRYSGVNQTDYSSRFANSTAAISIDTNGQTVTYASPIANTNSGGLTKFGAGTLYLNAANQYAGTTTVNAGTLAGTGSVLGQLSVQPGAVFDPGSGPGATTIFGAGAFAQASGGTTKMQVNGTTAGSLYDQVLFSGTSKTVSWGGTLDLTLSGSYANYTTFDLFSGFTTQSGNLSGIALAAGSPYDSLSFSGPVGGVWYTGVTSGGQYMTFNQGTGVLMVVPEPSTIIGLGGAGAMFVFAGIFRRRKAVRKVSHVCAALLLCWIATNDVAKAVTCSPSTTTSAVVTDMAR